MNDYGKERVFNRNGKCYCYCCSNVRMGMAAVHNHKAGMNRFEDRMVSAAGWEGKMRPVNVNNMFFADDPDKMEGWGVGMMRRKNNWALWVDGKGFVCGDEHMCYPVRPNPVTMSKETAKILCKKGIAHWGRIFFVENKDYYKKLIEKMVKKMGYIQLDNPVEIKSWVWKDRYRRIDHVDYVEGIAVCAFQNHKGEVESLNCYDTMSIVNVGRELVRTLINHNIKLR